MVPDSLGKADFKSIKEYDFKSGSHWHKFK